MDDTEMKQEVTLKFMEMVNIDYDEAKIRLEMSQFNIQSALSSLLESRIAQQKQSTKKDTTSVISKPILKDQPSSNRQIIQSKTNDLICKRQRQKMTIQKSRVIFRTTYIVNKQREKKKNKKRSKKKQEEQQLAFWEYFQLYLNQPLAVSFYEDVDDLFEDMWNSRRLVALHCLHFNPKSGDNQGLQADVVKFFLRDIYTSMRFAAIFHKEFLNFLLDPTMQIFSELSALHSFVNPQKDKNVIIILRLNQKSQLINRATTMNIFECIKPNRPDSFHKYMAANKRDINRAIDMQICSSIQHNPLNTIEKIKLDEDRKIRNEQQIAYMEMGKDMKVEVSNQKIDNQQSIEQIQMMKRYIQKQAQIDLIKFRDEKWQKLKKYSKEQLKDPFLLKLRMPSGSLHTLYLPKNQKWSYIQTYIECNPQPLGFDHQLRRNCQLVQPWSQEVLSPNKKSIIHEIFPDSIGETLIVKQDD